MINIKVTIGNKPPIFYLGESVPIKIYQRWYQHTIIGIRLNRNPVTNWFYQINFGDIDENSLWASEYQLMQWKLEYNIKKTQIKVQPITSKEDEIIFDNL